MKLLLRALLWIMLIVLLAGSTALAATVGEKNALRSAEDFVSMIPFSRSGLIEQLEYGGYTQQECLYAVDNCGADWYEQAVLCGNTLMELMAFSRTGLIEQLECTGFTSEEATYAANMIFDVEMEEASKAGEAAAPEQDAEVTVFAGSYDEFLSGLSLEELTKLHSLILQRITVVKSGDIVYDEDGITITWIGIKDKTKAGFICANHTGRKLSFDIENFGINGTLISINTNGDALPLEDGLSIYTGSYYKWLFDREVLKDLHIEHVNEIYLHIRLRDTETNEYHDITVSFPVDETI